MDEQLPLDAVEFTIEMYEKILEKGYTLEPDETEFLKALKAFLDQKKRKVRLSTIPDAAKAIGA